MSHTTPQESEYKARLKAIGVEISNDNNDDNSNNDGLLFDFDFVVFVKNNYFIFYSELTGSRNNLISSFDASNMIDKDIFNSVNLYFLFCLKNSFNLIFFFFRSKIIQ